MHLAFATFLFTLLIAQTPATSQKDPNDNELIVELPFGQLRGRDNDFYYSYESIPYAEPPLGALRFESPLPYNQSWTEIFNATAAPVECMQWDQYAEGDDKLHGVEDCLTVNIYKPKLPNTAEKLPVLIAVHGGAFMFGSPNAFGHEYLMRSGRVMVVKMTYRVGPLGFLSTEDAVIAGNFGLKDQRLALQWIKQHIAHFGGDPQRMLLLGFSSGGVAVHLHMFQRNLSDYVNGVVAASGNAFNPWAIMRSPRARAIALAQNLNCSDVSSSQAVKECLQQQRAEDIVRGVRNFLVFGYNPFTTFGPVVEHASVEDAFLTRLPKDYVMAGDFAPLPLLVSYAAQDGGYNAGELLQKQPEGGEMIEELNERWYDLAPYLFFYKERISSIEELDEYSGALKQRYLGDKHFSVENYEDVQRMYTDVLFRNGVEKAIKLHRQHGKSAVYAYVYENPAEVGLGAILAKRTDIKMGTTHGDDFFLIFKNNRRAEHVREDEVIISKKLIKMFEDFTYDSQKIVYDSCEIVDNVGQENLHILLITKDNCTDVEGATLPSF